VSCHCAVPVRGRPDTRCRVREAVKSLLALRHAGGWIHREWDPAEIQTERTARWLGLLVIDGLLLRCVTIKPPAVSAFLSRGYPATYEQYGAG
jgi:hypothetical protein